MPQGRIKGVFVHWLASKKSSALDPTNNMRNQRLILGPRFL